MGGRAKLGTRPITIGQKVEQETRPESSTPHVKMTSNYGVLMKSAKSFDDNQFSTIKNDNDFMPPPLTFVLCEEILTQLRRRFTGKFSQDMRFCDVKDRKFLKPQ